MVIFPSLKNWEIQIIPNWKWCFGQLWLRLPLESISTSLEIQYGLEIKESTIQNILHNLKKKFGPKYEGLINEVRKNKIKHADETGWRIKGQNAWCWMFSSPETIVYTISLLEASIIVKEKGISKNFHPVLDEAIREFNEELKIRSKKKLQ